MVAPLAGVLYVVVVIWYDVIWHWAKRVSWCLEWCGVL